MKQVTILLFSYFLIQTAFAQSDSVYLSIDSKLIPEIQIITPNGENGIRENYSYFKYRYWLVEIDTVLMATINKNETVKSKKNKIEYQKLGACDSIINEIRNSAEYWKMYSEINKIAKREIGYDNEAFKQFEHSESTQIKNFSKKCKNEFKIEIVKLKSKFVIEINRIKKEKLDRLNRLKTNPKSIDSTVINSFLETFDICETDFKVLELIILQNPNGFVTIIDQLNDFDFFMLTLQLGDFPEDSNILKMKEALQELEQKSKRKKKVIRKIKKSKRPTMAKNPYQ